MLEKIRPEIVKALEQAVADQADRHDTHQLQQVMRRVAGRYVGQRLRGTSGGRPDSGLES